MIDSNCACGATLVGSVPLADSEAVFREAATRLGRHVRRIPDGETGVRKQWVAWQYPLFKGLPFVEELPEAEQLKLAYRPPRGAWQVKPGTRDADIVFPELGYARVALESWAVFRQLADAGVVPAGVRFQVCLPSPLAPLAQMFLPDAHRRLDAAYSDAMLADLARILAAIPAECLAIQWDVATEFAALEGVRRVWFAEPERDMIDRLARLGNSVPAAVELGYHHCYGDSTTRHFVEPKDTGLMVRVANGIARGLTRDLQWVHMPVPIERDDDAFFAPLQGLRLHPATELYLGLVHLSDGDEGAARRIAAAARHVARFGVATECGFGRRSAEIIPAVFDLHARAAAAVR